MFVESRVPVPLPFAQAREAFEAALADGGVVLDSLQAADHSMAAFLTPAGQHVLHMLSSQVRVQVSVNPRFTNDIVTELHWSPAGTGRRFFPQLDADLALSPRSHDDCGMSIVACYQPPPGFGPRFARLVALHLAQSTVEVFLGNLRNRLIATPTSADAGPVFGRTKAVGGTGRGCQAETPSPTAISTARQVSAGKADRCTPARRAASTVSRWLTSVRESGG